MTKKKQILKNENVGKKKLRIKNKKDMQNVFMKTKKKYSIFH